MVVKEHKQKRNTGQVNWVRTGTQETYQKVYEKVDKMVEEGAAGTNNVQVAVRIRPLSNKDQFLGTKRAAETSRGKNTVAVAKMADVPPGASGDKYSPSPHEKKEFPFDVIFSEHHGQQDVFEQVVIDLLVNSWIGYNLCVFAYGQTGSGKSYTMQGAGEDVGIIPRFCESLFATIAIKEAEVEKLNVMKGRELVFDWQVNVQYVQIYNEQIQDLLAEETGGRGTVQHGLKIREHAVEGTYVEGAGKVRAQNFEAIAKLMEQAVGRRAMASHELNNSSSRSHCVMIIYFSQRLVERSDHDGGYGNDSEELEVYNKFPHINLVDLAGSEDNRRTLTSGQTLQEGCNINRSLTTLGRCITALAENCSHNRNGSGESAFDFSDVNTQKPRRNSTGAPHIVRRKSMGHNSPTNRNGTPHPNHSVKHVPFRDSALTKLLKGSLDGNSKTVMLATISPAATDVDETLGTLRYASLCKKIVTRAVAIESRAENPKLVKMASEMMDLRRKMADASAMNQQLQLTKEEALRANAEKEQMQQEMQRQLGEARQVEEAFNALAAEHSQLAKDSYEERQQLLEQLQQADQQMASARTENEEERHQLQVQLESTAQELEQMVESSGATKDEVRELHATIDDLQMERMEAQRTVEEQEEKHHVVQQLHKRTEQEALSSSRRQEQQLEELRAAFENEQRKLEQQVRKHLDDKARWKQDLERQEEVAKRARAEAERQKQRVAQDRVKSEERLRQNHERALAKQQEELTRQHEAEMKDREEEQRKQLLKDVSEALVALTADAEHMLRQRLDMCRQAVRKWENAQAEVVAVEAKAARAATPDSARWMLTMQRKRSSRLLLDDAQLDRLKETGPDVLLARGKQVLEENNITLFKRKTNQTNCDGETDTPLAQSRQVRAMPTWPICTLRRIFFANRADALFFNPFVACAIAWPTCS
jgi:hypothetical protein